MHLSTCLDDVVVFAPAKVNLFLEVLGKRPDGYHEIATLMVAVRLFDTLVFGEGPSNEITLRCSDARLSSGPDNLVFRAAHLLQAKTGCKLGAQIHLIKRIPLAAGLAGGSSDAAATLVGLNHLWKLGLTMTELAAYSAELGSDIPFFFYTPAAWCTGRGEIVTPVEIGAPLEFVFLCPAFGMSTAGVYKNVTIPQAPESGDAIRLALAQGDVDRIGKLLHNRLQAAAETLDPRIGRYQRLLAERNPAGQLMSGSGSTLFALCWSSAEAERLAESLKSPLSPGGRGAGREGDEKFQLILTRSL